MTRTTTLRRLGLSVAALAFTAGSLTACGGDDDSSDTAADSSTAPSAAASSDAADDSGSDDSGSDDSADIGDGDDAPDDVSVTDFCAAYSDYFSELQKASTDLNNLDIGTIKNFASTLSKLGTPADIPDDARNGFEVSVDAAADLPDDATPEDLASLQSDVSADDQADAAAFGQYVVKTCPELLSGLGASPSS